MATANSLEVLGSNDVAVPPAASLPPGTMILSTSGIDRTGFRVGIAVLAFGIFAAGFASGIVFQKGRKRG